jgi:hypothetical protein
MPLIGRLASEVGNDPIFNARVPDVIKPSGGLSGNFHGPHANDGDGPNVVH